MARIRKTETSSKTTQIIWRIGGYIRLSREDGSTETDESISVTNQRKTIDECLETFSDPFVFVGYFIDDGYTGTDSNRKEFQRLISLIKNGDINCVIVKDISRISRNYSEAGMYLDELFVKYNVRLISLTIPVIDSYLNPESMNSIAVPIISVFNDDFAKQTSLKVRKTFDTKRSRGEFIGAFAPYGYSKSPQDKNCLVIDVEASEIVKKIFHWYVFEGMSKGSITKKLNELGLQNPTSYKRSNNMKYGNNRANDGLWTPKTISDILKNQVYIGDMVQGRQRVKSYKVHEAIAVPEDEWFIVKNTHEAIVDDDTFEKAQALRMRDTRTAPKEQVLSLFAGFLKCADCGKALRRTSSKGLIYYVCRTNREKSLTACTRHTIREDVLQKAVLEAIRKQIALVDDMNQIIEEINKLPELNNKSDRLEKMLRNKQSDLSKATNVIDSLYLDWKNGDITKEMFVRMKAKLENDIERTKKSITNTQDEISLMEKGVTNENPLFKAFLKNRNVQELDRNLLINLIDTICVHEDKHITIKFNFADTYVRVIEFIETNKAQLVETVKPKTSSVHDIVLDRPIA